MTEDEADEALDNFTQHHADKWPETCQAIDWLRAELSATRDGLHFAQTWKRDLDAVSRELAATRKAKAENDERFAALKALWNDCGARMDHDSRCAVVTMREPYPHPRADGCDCGLRALTLAMEAK